MSESSSLGLELVSLVSLKERFLFFLLGDYGALLCCFSFLSLAARLDAAGFGEESFIGGFFAEATEAVGDCLGVEAGACSVV